MSDGIRVDGEIKPLNVSPYSCGLDADRGLLIHSDLGAVVTTDQRMTLRSVSHDIAGRGPRSLLRSPLWSRSACAPAWSFGPSRSASIPDAASRRCGSQPKAPSGAVVEGILAQGRLPSFSPVFRPTPASSVTHHIVRLRILTGRMRWASAASSKPSSGQISESPHTQSITREDVSE